MSFLDNLESSLKSLEGNNERAERSDRKTQQDERTRARAIAPQAEILKKSPFTNDLLTHAVRIAHGMRIKVNMSWLGSTLRLDARERRLELQPTETEVLAIFFEDGQETRREPIDFSGDAQALAASWLSV